MRIVVTAASKHGATDGIVIGSTVYAGRWLAPAKDLVERLAAQGTTIPVWLFSSGPLGDPPKPAEEPADAVATG